MTSLRRDLFERRLWPLVIVIIAAIVAVPLLLHGHAANAGVIAPPPASTTSTTPVTPTTSHRAPAPKRRTPTSRIRDPFAEAGVTAGAGGPPSSASRVVSTTSVTRISRGSAASGTGASGTGAPASTAGSSPTPPSSTVTPAPVASAPPANPAPAAATRSGKVPSVHHRVSRSHPTSRHRTATTRSWDIYSVDVRLSTPWGRMVRRNLARLTPLPTERSPQVMYMGVARHGHAAVFALGAGVEVRALRGDSSAGAVCQPSRVHCALVAIPAGRTVALSYVSSTGAIRTLLLRLRRVATHVTRSGKAVRIARRYVSALGLCDLKLGDPIGFFNLADAAVKIPTVRACRRHRLAVPFPGSLASGASVRG